MFNIRVYGLWQLFGHILLSEEDVKGMRALKFPGGGLEFGEGTLQCLKREFKEELDEEIEILQHLYTTDFFVRSFINNRHQVVSIYYQIKSADPHLEKLPVFPTVELNNQIFIWRALDKIKPEELSFPIDQEFLRRLQKKEIALL